MTLDPALSICTREWRAAAKHLRLIFHPTLIRWACSGEKNSDFDHNHQHVGVSIQLGAFTLSKLDPLKSMLFSLKNSTQCNFI